MDIEEFKSLPVLLLEREIQELNKKNGFSAIHFADILVSIKLLKQDNSEEVIHLPNSFYIPKFGNSPCVYNPLEMTIKPKNYFQVQLQDLKASAVYVTNYFNTENGKKIRKSLEIGSSFPQISKSLLNNCVLFLPDTSMQSELIKLDTEIEKLSLRLNEVHQKLWKQPRNHKSIAKEIKNINNEVSLTQWIDNLPFPISSILWRYYATKNNGEKIDHLFHFFEAFSEFLSMIILSALKQDEEFCKKEKHKWIQTSKNYQNWYLKATFGNWNSLTSKLSTTIDEYLSDKNKSEYCRNLLGNPNDSFITMIAAKSTTNVLFEVANLRNLKAHGGISSADDKLHRLLVLEKYLNDLRKCIADSFEDMRMLAPTTNSYEDGIFTFNARELVGARMPFNEITIKSLIPLDIKKLYIIHTNQLKPIELIPFIKYVEVSSAFYFYSRIESTNVRWVSYHFEKESEISQPIDDDLLRAFNFLKAE